MFKILFKNGNVFFAPNVHFVYIVMLRINGNAGKYDQNCL